MPVIFLNLEALILFIIIIRFFGGSLIDIRDDVEINNLRDLLYFLFIFNPRNFAFGLVYFFIMRAGVFDPKYIIENILLTKLATKSR